ncbi:MAG: outer membrane lipoprotein-sorting protein [Chromatiaceae bacterium]|nr:outer membrane lipoprotein-sorting protein [Chromatiaceae bacterium]
MQLLLNLLSALLIGLVPVASAVADDAEDAGRKLAQAVYDAPNGDDFASRAVMTLIEKGRSTRKREMYTMRVDKGGGEQWSFTRFTSPSDISGVGLLTRDHPSGESDQWLYLPALDRVRRVSSSRKGGRFVGSDLFFEDLLDRKVGMDRHRLSGEDKVGGLNCKVLISEPIDPGNSVYSKRISWIHPGTLTPLRIDLYQGNADKPTKRLTVKKIKRIQGFWTVLESMMEDLDTGHVTRIAISAVKYNQKIPDQLFTSQALSDESAETRYRP